VGHDIFDRGEPSCWVRMVFGADGSGRERQLRTGYSSAKEFHGWSAAGSTQRWGFVDMMARAHSRGNH
jgi:hypothetical protein